jgi:hypothetical protein
VAITRTREKKEHPHYNFLVSYDPKKVGVNRESYSKINISNSKLTASKRAAELAKEDSAQRIKKDIVKSLMIIFFVLAAEVVVYLARNQIRLP